MSSQINYHNYKLTNKLISAGFESIMIDTSKIIDFINGNISYVPYVPAKPTLNVPSSHQLAVVNGYRWNHNIQHFSIEESDKICKYYWTGEGAIATEIQDIETGNKIITNSDVLNEYLIEGILDEIE